MAIGQSGNRAIGQSGNRAIGQSEWAFFDKEVLASILEYALMIDRAAPNCANVQLGNFLVVRGAATKQHIRQATEVEGHELPVTRASDEALGA